MSLYLFLAHVLFHLDLRLLKIVLHTSKDCDRVQHGILTPVSVFYGFWKPLLGRNLEVQIGFADDVKSREKAGEFEYTGRARIVKMETFLLRVV